MKIVRSPILGTLLIGVAISMLVGHILGQGPDNTVPVAVIVGLVGALLR